MAERRMFSLKVVDQDTFLDLPPMAQLLYFHLSVRADDDGFVTPKKVMRLIGATDSDLERLISTGHLIAFDSGLVVDRFWRTNNYIQKDRYVESEHSAERSQLVVVGGKYEEKALLSETASQDESLGCKEIASDGNDESCIQNVSKMDTKCIQNVSKMDTQDRIGKNKERTNNYVICKKESRTLDTKFAHPSPDEVQAYLDEKGIKTISGEAFCDFYESKGWMVGKNHMKSWKAAVRTWVHQDQRRGIDPYKPLSEQKTTGMRSPSQGVVQRDVTGMYDDDVAKMAK